MADPNAPQETAGLPNWIKALGLLAVLVAVANGAMVWLSLKGNRDLVRKDYYQAGLDQDARMSRRALAAAYDVTLDLSAGAGAWTVAAAPRASGPGAAAPLAGARCRVRLRRPDDGRLDRVVELPAAGPAWTGPGADLRRGQYDVLVEWERDGAVFMEAAFARWIDG